VRRPDLIDGLVEAFGSQFVVLAIDAKATSDGWRVHLNGGRMPTDRDLLPWACEGAERGAGEILFTSMDHDGTKQGFACDATARVAEAVPIPVIASGGAGCMDHFTEVFTRGKADAGLAASIFHFGEIALSDLKAHLAGQGVPVRI
jgi:cyclase